ncbi:PaaI family thioesterase [Aestuariicella hydrocarbonica]|uniref:PaaI family thioesterase n=1 Tax=Pseudomaricurvus hydrocarbonicus TaxID=1470433 RepID=A0A9E5MHG6_9GAMM|nr:PaaI family thioesterase [Aestuariicella hydrocarbonica]NHO65916.1 PaaI family thioesterase [Aestuariicella hydrocarbonica]
MPEEKVIDCHTLEAEGWTSLSANGFTGLAGPFWSRGEGEERAMGLLLEERHSNNHLGTVHGGVVMTFADIGLGSAVAVAMGEKRMGCVTVSLQTQFVSVARVGEFMTCQPEIVRASKQLLFIRGLIKVGDKTIASAEGIWKLLDSASD